MSGTPKNGKNHPPARTLGFSARILVGTLSMTTSRSTRALWSLANRVAARAPGSCPTSAIRLWPQVIHQGKDVLWVHGGYISNSSAALRDSAVLSPMRAMQR
jgi:hypothetical protein